MRAANTLNVLLCESEQSNGINLRVDHLVLIEKRVKMTVATPQGWPLVSAVTNQMNLVDPASRDMLLSRTKPCMFQSMRMPENRGSANGSLNSVITYPVEH